MLRLFYRSDGIAPFDEIPMTLLYFWVRILQIPPLYSTKPMIKDIAPKLQLDVNVEKEIHFFYENMASICERCNLIYHVEDRCPLGKQIPKAPGLQIPSLKVTPVGGLGNLMETNFRFQGGLPNPTNLPFGAGATPSKARRPIILKKKLFQEEADSSAGELSLEHANVEKGTACPSSGPAQILCLDMIREDEVELEAESVMPTNEADSVVQTGEADSVVPTSEADKQQGLTLALPLAPMSLKMVVKRQQPFALRKSPVKLAASLPSLFKSCFDDVPLKKLKMPQFTSSFTARSLNLVGARGNVLIPREHATLKAAPKKKRGRPLGSKNKKPSRAQAPANTSSVEDIFGSFTSSSAALSLPRLVAPPPQRRLLLLLRRGTSSSSKQCRLLLLLFSAATPTPPLLGASSSSFAAAPPPPPSSAASFSSSSRRQLLLLLLFSARDTSSSSSRRHLLLLPSTKIFADEIYVLTDGTVPSAYSHNPVVITMVLIHSGL
ncbi:hypothetical protein ACLB2K_042235 [Fragaria x ananassa]